jgi:hypothetical protein
MIDLQLNKTYIFDVQPMYYSAPFKGEVKEITETTVLLKNLDTELDRRYNLKEFKDQWRVLEEVTRS